MTQPFEKTVAIKATNDDDQTAVGRVLTPNELDRQLDFFDENGVRTMFNESPNDGVMHASFPSDHTELTRNEVLSADETIDGHEFDKGDWIIQRQYTDPARWSLVKSGTLGGFSIGGEVSETIEYDSMGTLPTNVEVPAVVDPDTVPDKYHPPSKVTRGKVTEISDVDVPAVPSASHAVVKSMGKNVLDVADNRGEFVELMQERGATTDGAESLYDYMTDVNKHDMTDPDELDDATRWQRLKTLLGGEDGLGDSPTFDADDTVADFGKALGIDDIEKDARVLSDTNQSALMAAHDSIEGVLAASDVQFRPNRFTDDPYINFDVSEYGKSVDIMTDDTDTNEPDEETKALAEQNADRLDSIAEKLDKALDAPDSDEGEEGAEKTLPEQNAETVEALDEKIDQLIEQGGASQQAGKSTPDESERTKADVIALENEVFGT